MPSGRRLHEAMFAVAGEPSAARGRRCARHRPSPGLRLRAGPAGRPARARGPGRRRAARTRSPRSSATSPTCGPSRPRSVARGHGSSRRPTRSVAGWSATSTTAPSSGSCRSRSRCAACGPGSPPRPGEDAEAIAAADEAAAELKLAIQELRELARGIHPAILTEAGLGRAITALAERSAVPATVRSVPDRRLPPAVEATAYFVVSEALANVAKHAQRDERQHRRRPRRRRRSASRSATTASAARMPPTGPASAASRIASPRSAARSGWRARRARARWPSPRSRSAERRLTGSARIGRSGSVPRRGSRDRTDARAIPRPIVCSSIGRHPADEEGAPR